MNHALNEAIDSAFPLRHALSDPIWHYAALGLTERRSSKLPTDPENGRSTPDAVKRMNVSVNFLRDWDKGQEGGGSTNVGDVSYTVPAAKVLTACAPLGTPAEFRQAVGTAAYVSPVREGEAPPFPA